MPTAAGTEALVIAIILSVCGLFTALVAPTTRAMTLSDGSDRQIQWRQKALFSSFGYGHRSFAIQAKVLTSVSAAAAAFLAAAYFAPRAIL
jgi:hypothetical protein